MKLHDVTALAVKIAGLVLFVIVLSKIPEYVNSYLQFENSQNPISYLYYVLPLLIVAVACLLLFFFPYKISNHLLIDSDSTVSPSNFANQLQAIAIRLLALLLLFWSISDIVFHFFVYFIYRDIVEASYGAGTYDYPSLFATFAELAFALVLLIKAKNISSYLNSVGK